MNDGEVVTLLSFVLGRVSRAWFIAIYELWKLLVHRSSWGS